MVAVFCVGTVPTTVSGVAVVTLPPGLESEQPTARATTASRGSRRRTSASLYSAPQRDAGDRAPEQDVLRRVVCHERDEDREQERVDDRSPLAARRYPRECARSERAHHRSPPPAGQPVPGLVPAVP